MQQTAHKAAASYIGQVGSSSNEFYFLIHFTYKWIEHRSSPAAILISIPGILFRSLLINCFLNKTLDIHFSSGEPPQSFER